MAGSREEPLQIRCRDRRGHGVDQRMGVHRPTLGQAAVQGQAYHARIVVDQGKRGHRTRLDAELAAQPVGAAEREPAGAQHLAKPLQVDRTILEGDHQPHLLLLVAQEEVLDVMARQVAAQHFCLLDGEHRRVLDGPVGDAQGFETVE